MLLKFSWIWQSEIAYRDETNTIAVGLNCMNGSQNSHQPIGNDSLEVAEILEGEGR